MTGITIGVPGPADADAWLALRAALWPDEARDAGRAEIDAFFAGANPALVQVFLATAEDGAVVGFAEFSVRAYVPGAPASAPFLEGWFVLPQARGRGIGRALVAAGERWAAAQGYTALGSDVLAGNDDGAAAHRALGFRAVEQVTFFIKDVTAGA